MNPKIAAMQIPVQEMQDYPRWTPEFRRFLEGLEEFRRILRGARWN